MPSHWTCFGVLPIVLLLACRGSGKDARGGVKFCQNRKDRSRQETERCFGLRLKTALPEGGLFNQHLTLLSFITLGIASGCEELVIEHSPRRKSSMAVSKWEQEPMDSLWDANHLTKYLEGQGVSLWMGSQKAHIQPHPLASFRSLLEHREDISDAVDHLRKHVLGELLAMPGLLDLPRQHIPSSVEVAIPSDGTFRGLRTGHSHLYRDVAKHTKMAPQLQSLAQSCIERMGSGNGSYVGIHLRIEDDFDRIGRSGGRSNMLRQYTEALRHQGIEHNAQLYIASGIFADEPDFADQNLREWSSRITHRDMLLSAEETGTLDVEQLAAIDYLIVSRATVFIGCQGSSFSFWVPEERALHGLEASTSLLIRSVESTGSEHDAFVITHSVTKD